MKVSEKIALIDEVARVLVKRYKQSEIDAFLREFGLYSSGVSFSYPIEYTKAALFNQSNDIILRIAEDLQIDVFFATANASTPPRAWQNTNNFRLFISHISLHKDKATRLKEALSAHRIEGFVAHEDIEPTAEWQQEIERALYSMQALVAIHTNGFKASSWTQQEVGFALGRGTKVISLKMESEDPTGLISKQQALSRRKRNAEEIALEIKGLLEADIRTADALKAASPELFSGDLDDEIPF